MIFPFIHKTAAGLLIGEDRLAWVRVALLRGRLTHLSRDEEVFEEGQIEEALERMSQRIPLSRVQVATALPSLRQRELILQGPVIEQAEDFDAWLDGALKKVLPAGAHPGQFAVSCQILALNEAAMHCLVLIARKEVSSAAALAERGFMVSHLSTPLAGMQKLLSLGGYVGREHVLLLDRKQLLFFSDGCPVDVEELSGETADELLAEVEHHLALRDPEKQEKLLISGEGADTFAALCRDIFPAIVLSLNIGNRSLPARFASAAALALTVTALGSVNILHFDAQERARESVHKSLAHYAMLRAGLAALILLLISTAGTMVSERLRAEAGEEHTSLTSELAQIEIARKELDALEDDLARAKRVSMARSNRSGLLAGIAALVPSGVWLTSISLAEDGAVLIAGAGLGREDVTRLLRALEGAVFCEEVWLLHTREVHRDKLFQGREERLQKEWFTTFELALRPATDDVRGVPEVRDVE